MRKTLFTVATIAMTLPGVAFAVDMTSLKTQLQASAQRHLERQMIDGAIVHIDLSSGESTQFYPTDNHPMIVSMGENYVMCADLMTKTGETAPVDFYLVKSGERYRVVRQEVNNRAPLKALVDAGKAEMLK